MASGADSTGEVPQWLAKLEEQRERRLKAKLGHETGAGAPCLTCEDKCPGLDLHFWRKICKNCKCGKESHDVSDDDIYGFAQFQLLGSKPIKGKKIVLPGKKEAVDLEWTPKGITTAVEKYLGELPPELLPVKGTEAAQIRKQRLLKQMPAHDIDPTLCHALTEDEIAKFLEYVAHIKQSSVGQGQITQLSLLRGQLHHMRPANGQLVSQKIAGDVSTSQNAILHPYSKTDALSKKLEQQLTLNSNNPQSAQYPDEKMQYPMQDAMKLRDLNYDANLNNKQKRSGIYSNTNELAESLLEESGNEFGIASPYKQGTLPHYAPGSFKTYENPQNPVNVGTMRELAYDVNTNPAMNPNAGFDTYIDESGQLQYRYPQGYRESAQNPANVGTMRELAYDVNTNPAANAPVGAFDTYIDESGQLQYKYPQGYKGDKGIQRPTDLNMGSQRHYPPGYVANPNLNVPEYMQNPTNVSGGYNSNREDVPFPHGDSTTVHDNQKHPNSFVDASTQSRPLYNMHTHPNMLGQINQPQQGYDAYLQGVPFPSGDTNVAYENQNHPTNYADGSLQSQPLGYNSNANSDDLAQINAGDTSGGLYPHGFGDLDNKAKGALPPRYPNQAYNPNSNVNLSEYQQNPTIENVGIIRDLNYPASEIRSAVYHNEDLGASDLRKTDPRDLENSNLLDQIPMCHKCKKVFEPDEIVISIERTDALWHTDCFKCEACNQILADLVYFYHKKSDTIYCGRDYAKIKGIPRCSACDELIFVQEYCLAENSTFHIKHFCCFECDTPLAGQNYVMEGSQPLCLPCFDTCKAAKCNSCKSVIHPDQQGAMVKDVHFHVTPECFACKQCKKSLIGAKLLLKNDNLFCSAECFQKHG